MKLRKKALVSSYESWGRGTCNTGVMLHELDLQLMLEVVCAHVFCSVVARDTVALRLTGGALNLGTTHWSTKDSWMYFNKQDWSFKENCSRVEALMENTRWPSSSSLSSSFASTSPLTAPPHPPPPDWIWHNVLMLISTAQLGPAPGTNTV